MTAITTSLFTDFGVDLSHDNANKNTVSPLKNHPQIPLIIDSLSRYNRHHLAFISHSSDKIHQAFIEAVAEHIQTETTPKSLRNSPVMYFDAMRFLTTSIGKDKMAHDFQTLTAELKNKNQRIIFAINQLDLLTMNDSNAIHLSQMIKEILLCDEWRIILFISEKNTLKKSTIEHLFSITHLAKLNKDEQITLLKNNCFSLENFHHAMISDEVIHQAYTMATHYLPGDCDFNKTFELLDSAAARANLPDRHEHSESKSVVTPHFLMQVISHSTEVPVTHLQNTQFQAQKFIETLRKNIFGQDAAINMMASLLQNACIKLQDNSGPLCNFLLVGPQDAGKTEMAYAMAEHLFGHRQAVLHVNLENTDTHWLSAVQEKPYAIVLMENMDRMSHETFYLIKDIFTQGYLIDAENNQYDFRHTIIIATTRMASDQMDDATLSQSEKHPKTDLMQLDLMQLVLNEHVHDPLQQNTAWPSPHELCDVLMPKLTEHFPEPLLQTFNIIPFIPLDYAALEKIIKAKIKMLARRLQKSFSIELSFAPEVVKFLAHEALWRKGNSKSLDKLLEQHLYSTVTHEILLHAEDKDRSKRLVIQLNESGHLLRCEFLTSNEAAFYSL